MKHNKLILISFFLSIIISCNTGIKAVVEKENLFLDNNELYKMIFESFVDSSDNLNIRRTKNSLNIMYNNKAYIFRNDSIIILGEYYIKKNDTLRDNTWYYYKESELFLLEFYNKGTLKNYAKRKGNKFYYINYNIYTPSF